MIAGCAVVAYPADWANSGVMTFIVNQQGRVYQKDLGPKTWVIAGHVRIRPGSNVEVCEGVRSVLGSSNLPSRPTFQVAPP